MSEALDRIAHWIQAQDEALLYAPDGAPADVGDIAPEGLASHDVLIEDVCRWFAIPAHLLGIRGSNEARHE